MNEQLRIMSTARKLTPAEVLQKDEEYKQYLAQQAQLQAEQEALAGAENQEVSNEETGE